MLIPLLVLIPLLKYYYYPIQGELKKETKPSVTKVTKTLKKNSIHLSGISQHIELTDIKSLWQRFTQSGEHHKYLKHQPKKVYVLYTSISKNYEQADVLIGYNISNLREFNKSTAIDMRNNSLLMPIGKYSEQQIADAWKKIDYKNKLEYILEEHHLDDTGKTTSTKIYISYK